MWRSIMRDFKIIQKIAMQVMVYHKAGMIHASQLNSLYYAN